MHYRVGEYLLRKPEPSDVEALYQFKNDPEVAAMLGGYGRGYARAELAQWVEFHRSARDEAFWIVADTSDRATGHVGLYKIDHRIGSAEFAILLGDRGTWGKGLGKAFTRFVVEYAFTTLNLQRVYLEVLETNERAQKLYLSLGFALEGRMRRAQFKDGRHLDVLMMALLRDEWPQPDAP